MKKILKRALALAAVLCLAATTALAAGVPAAPTDSCVLDEANVLSAATEQAVNDLTIALDKATGAQIAVLTVEFTGNMSTDDFAYETFNSWGVGDAKKNNGVLLLLVIGDEDYYCVTGTGLEREILPSRLDDLLYDNLEPGFAVRDYDKGVTAFVNAMYDELCDIYNVQPNVGGTTGEPGGSYPGYEPPRTSFFDYLGTIIILGVILVIVVLSAALHPVRYVRTRWFGYTYPPMAPRRHWWGHSHYHRPPPPPPGYGHGPYGGHRPPPPPRPPHSSSFGGFGGGSSSSRPSRPSRPSGGSFGGFGGGSSRGGGAGRRPSSGGGGSRPSGGAGRRK